MRVLGRGGRAGRAAGPAPTCAGPPPSCSAAKGEGTREAVARRCDGLVQIPQRGLVASLNVSVAGAILLYEAMRQRRALTSRERRWPRHCVAPTSARGAPDGAGQHSACGASDFATFPAEQHAEGRHHRLARHGRVRARRAHARGEGLRRASRPSSSRRPRPAAKGPDIGKQHRAGGGRQGPQGARRARTS